MSKAEINISDISQPTKVTKSKSKTTQETKGSLQEIKKQTSGSKNRFFILFAIAGILLITVFAIFYAVYKAPDTKKDLANITTPYIEPGALINKLNCITSWDFIPQQPKTKENPINGLLFTPDEYSKFENNSPVAVMVNNHVHARPQSNVDDADIVFETMAEGGITRLMAIYWSKQPTKVGPIRSARQYFIEWLSPFDAIYIHDGCARSTDIRVDACGNIYRYGIKNIATQGAWRVHTEGRYPPHNEYSSIPTVLDLSSRYGWNKKVDIKAWKFKPDAPIQDRGLGKPVTIVFWQRLNNYGMYDVVWKYDKESNTYLRWIGGNKDLDHEDKRQIKAKNVIIQSVTMIPTYDEKARVIIKTIDKGNAWILQDGNVIKAKWEKKSRKSRTVFTDENGNEIKFNRGLIWVEAVPKDQGKVTFENPK